MKFLLDMSDSSRSRKGWSSLYANTVFLLKQEVDAGRAVEITLVDDGTAASECQQVADSALFNDPLVTLVISRAPLVALGLLADLSAAGRLYRPADNWDNLDITLAPVDPNSAAIIAFIRGLETTGGRMHPDFGGNYGIPYCVVDRQTPRVHVTFGNPSESDAGWNGVDGYPIPEAAKTNLRYIENAGSLDGDRHMLLLDRDDWVLYELSYVKWDGSSWSAGYGAIFDLKTNYRRPEGWTSTDAAGMAVLPTLMRHDELYGSQPIRHAFRISLKKINGYVWPASHRGSSDAGAPPLGMRLRLKPGFDITPYPAWFQRVLTAMKTYGLIVQDRGGNMYVQGTLDALWDNSALNPAFHSLHVTDFEVIELGWKPASQ